MKRVVYLEESMANKHDNVIFEAGIPYIVTGDVIINKNGYCVLIHDIWVDFRLVHQQIK